MERAAAPFSIFLCFACAATFVWLDHWLHEKGKRRGPGIEKGGGGAGVAACISMRRGVRDLTMLSGAKKIKNSCCASVKMHDRHTCFLRSPLANAIPREGRTGGGENAINHFS